MFERLGLGCFMLLAAAGCDDRVTCASGEVRYVGRPPSRMFSFDTSCREDCFSLASGTCDRACESEVEVTRPAGLLTEGDKRLHVLDTSSLPAGKAVLYSFGFVDEAGGDEPASWTFFSAGEQVYLTDQLFSSARFTMTTSVVAVETRQVQGVSTPVPTEVLAGPVDAKPGRLEVDAADPKRVAGRFYLAYDTPTGQRESQVTGCFDLDLVASDEESGVVTRILGGR